MKRLRVQKFDFVRDCSNMDVEWSADDEDEVDQGGAVIL
jgi:hypothetical protein